MEKKATIIPVASGKGGVGKSIFAANLSIALANLGYPTIAIDLDLGGANLNTYLGLPNNYPSIGDYLKSGKVRFSDLLVRTRTPNLAFLPGDSKTPFLANLSYDQRHMLLQNIKNLKATYIVLDIGAGCEFSTLNFFGLAYKGIIVSTSETPSVMNMILFLKNFIFRVISSSIHSNPEVFKLLNSIFKHPKNDTPITVMYLLNSIARIDKRLAAYVQKICSMYRPRIIFNMADSPEELNISEKVLKTIKLGLAMDAEVFGCIFFDNSVRMASKQKKVLVSEYPKSIAAQNIRYIAECINKYWNIPPGKRGMDVMEHAKQMYDVWKDGKYKLVA